MLSQEIACIDDITFVCNTALLIKVSLTLFWGNGDALTQFLPRFKSNVQDLRTAYLKKLVLCVSEKPCSIDPQPKGVVVLLRGLLSCSDLMQQLSGDIILGNIAHLEAEALQVIRASTQAPIDNSRLHAVEEIVMLARRITGLRAVRDVNLSMMFESGAAILKDRESKLSIRAPDLIHT